MTQWMIEAEGLTKSYARGRPPALEGAGLQVAPGEILGVIGPNGSGKTTLMGCLLGLLRPRQGWARLDGHPSGSLEANALVGYLPERLSFDPWMKGREFVAYHHALAGLPAADRDRDVERLLAQVGLDPDAWQRPIRAYSRGMLQRTGLAQALVGGPRCLFLDEPTSGMDPEGALQARNLIQAYAAQGAAVVVNSHQLEQLGKLCHKVVFLKEGRIQAREQWAGAGGLAWSVEWLASAGAAAAARAAAKKLGLADAVVAGRRLRAQVADESAAADLVAALGAAGVRVLTSGPLKGDLEKFFTEGADAGE